MARRLILSLLLCWLSPLIAAEPPPYDPVLPGQKLHFPADFGAHPGFRVEWWYITGWLQTEDQRNLGFQVTFFRTNPGSDPANPSRFAAKQILFAHAALSDPAKGHLLHDQRAARQGFGLASAALGNSDIRIDDWSLLRSHDGDFTTRISSGDFALDLGLSPTQPILLQGEQGFSRKGPDPRDASYYFSLPQLRVSGEVTENGRKTKVIGTAWLDREWSSSLLDPAAVGWDWLGVNLDDGGALTLFQLRDQQGQALWAGGSWREPDGATHILARDDVVFGKTRIFHSPRTGADYPVEREIAVRLGGAPRQLRVTPLLDDQELDSRLVGGPIYWEGAARLSGDLSGRAYLELTGYAGKLKL